MKHANVMWGTIAGVALFGAGLLFGQAPGVNIDQARHPNLADAQRAIVAAFQKIEVAQQQNNYDLGGHADNAKALLMRASDELKAAAEFADHRR